MSQYILTFGRVEVEFAGRIYYDFYWNDDAMEWCQSNLGYLPWVIIGGNDRIYFDTEEHHQKFSSIYPINKGFEVIIGKYVPKSDGSFGLIIGMIAAAILIALLSI